MKLRIIIHPVGDGRYWAEVPGFPGCVSEGESLETVRANIKEAFEGVFEVMQHEMAELHPEDQTPDDLDEVLQL